MSKSKSKSNKSIIRKEKNMEFKNQICTWDFTSYDVDIIKTKELLNKYCKEWTFQKELCPSTQKEHLQGRFKLKVRERLGTLRLKFEKWHLSITSNENKNNNFYVMKETSRIEGPWSNNDKEIKIPSDVLEMKTLFPWQEKLRNHLKKYDKRIIDVVIQPKGNCGKSSLTRYMMIYDNANILPYCNDYKDVMRMAYDVGEKDIYLIDMPRAINKEKLSQFFAAIETLKSGYCFDDRYGLKQRLFDRPRICVFTNVKPNLELVSKDMWKLWGIYNNDLIELESSEEIEFNESEDSEKYKKLDKSLKSKNKKKE